MSKKSVTELLPHGGVLIQNTADLFILQEFEKAGITWVGPYQIKATKLDPTILGAKFPFTIYVDENGLSWHGGRVVIYPASDFLKGEESTTTTDIEVEKLSWYSKLRVKLEMIKQGELLLSDYIEEIEERVFKKLKDF